MAINSLQVATQLVATQVSSHPMELHTLHLSLDTEATHNHSTLSSSSSTLACRTSSSSLVRRRLAIRASSSSTHHSTNNSLRSQRRGSLTNSLAKRMCICAFLQVFKSF